MKNLELAWQKVCENRGAGGRDGESIESFEGRTLKSSTKSSKPTRTDPQPVRQKMMPKPGQPGKERKLGIPRIYDRVCQQALTNRLEPVFDDANFGYRKGRSAKDVLKKVWRELKEGYEWVVDADLSDFFGSVDHEKLLLLVSQRIADGRVLGTIENMAEGRLLCRWRNTPDGTGNASGRGCFATPQRRPFDSV